MRVRTLWMSAFAITCIAALALIMLALASRPAEGAGWDASTISVGTDSSYVYSGDTLVMTASGYDYDGNDSNNLQMFDLKVTTYAGSVIRSWPNQAIGTLQEVAVEWTIPNSVASGSYYVRVTRPGETATLDSTTFYLTRRQSVSLELYDSYLTQGETMRIYIQIANDSVTSLSLVLNDTNGVKTPIVNSLGVTMGDNTYNWTVPRTVKPGNYRVEAFVPGGEDTEDYTSVYIMKRYVYISVTLSEGKYSDYCYAPGETVTIRLYADVLANYTVNITKETYIMKSWPRVQTDAGGQTNLSLAIPAAAGDGTYNITVRSEDGEEDVVETMTVQMYLINLYPERDAFLDGEAFTVFYTVRNLMDGALASPASGSWSLVESSVRVRESGTFGTSSGSFQVHLPAADTSHNGYYVRVWYNDTAASRSSSNSVFIDTGPLSFTFDVAEDSYMPGSVVIFTLETTVGAYSYYEPPAPDVPITKFTVSTRRAGSDWAVSTAYSVPQITTDAMGRAEVVIVIRPTTEDMTEFKVDATAAKGMDIRNESVQFTVRKSSDISAVINLDRTAYTAGQLMRVNVATYAPNVTGQLTYTYQIVGGSTYSSSSRVFLVKSTIYPYIDWTVPDNLEGTVSISVQISGPNGAMGAAYTDVEVYRGAIVTSASPSMFKANTTVRISYTYSSQGPDTPQMFYQIMDADDNTIREAQLPDARSGSFDFKVPPAASEYYIIRVLAYKNGKLLAQQVLQIGREPGYTLSLTVDRDVAAPGETVRISYKLTRHGGAPAIGSPCEIKYGGLTLEREFQTNKMEGTFDYKIPEGAPEGPYTIYVTWSPADSGTGAYSTVTVTATRAPGGLAMGRTDTLLMALTLLSLVVAIVAVLMARKLSKRLKALNPPPSPPQPAQPQPLPPVQPQPQVAQPPAEYALPATAPAQQYYQQPQQYSPPPQQYQAPPQPYQQPPAQPAYQPAPEQGANQPAPYQQAYQQPTAQPAYQPPPQPQPQPVVPQPVQPQPQEPFKP
jgi:hypothetical protein